MSFEAELRTLAADMQAEFNTELRRATERALAEGVSVARGTHRYRDRTGELSQSIRGYVVEAADGSVDAVLEATAPYAEFVNAKDGFMERAEAAVARTLEQQIAAAATRLSAKFSR